MAACSSREVCSQEAYFHLGKAAAANGMLYLHPDGTSDANGSRSWNATDACCSVDGRDVDDSAYLAGLIEEVAARVAVDRQRIYLVGHSNGAFMTHRMACDHADLVTAIVSVAGYPPADPADCQPTGPVAILQIHGSDDNQVRIDGGSLRGILAPGDDRLADYPSLDASLEMWARTDGCTGQRSATGGPYDLDRNVDGPEGKAETVGSAFSGCLAGETVELWLMQGVGHDPAVTPTFAETVIDWLIQHPKPA